MKHFYLIIFFVISAFTHVNAEIETYHNEGLVSLSCLLGGISAGKTNLTPLPLFLSSTFLCDP